MNFLPQMYKSSAFSSPINLNLRPEHSGQDDEAKANISSYYRRHTVLAQCQEETPECSHHKSHPRSKSMVLDIPFSDLQFHKENKNTFKKLFHSQNSIKSDHLLQYSDTKYLPLREGCEYLKPSLTEDLRIEHDCKLEGCQRVTINVSGLRFETQIRTLERLPHTLLGNAVKRNKFWDKYRGEFFFDRHRPTFQAVLYYYQSGGRLKRPFEVPMDIFINELIFYELETQAINSIKENEGYIVDSQPKNGPTNKCLHKIWAILEYPDSSIAAKVFTVVSISFILVSVVTFCTETLPAFKDSGCKNVTIVDSNGRKAIVQIQDFLDPLFLIESSCISFFVVELFLRFIVAPSKCKFLTELINWIDLVVIAPYFVFLTLNIVLKDCKAGNKSSILSVLRVIRVVRILKLSKHSEGLKILGMTLKTSVRELSMFLLFLAIATVIFSGAIFFAEMDHPETQFTSIPDAFWWAIVSITTVGYGDFVPKGAMGKIIGGVCVLSGVLAIALPVPVIVANFNNYYRHYTGTNYNCIRYVKQIEK